jgi:PmbA protein
VNQAKDIFLNMAEAALKAARNAGAQDAQVALTRQEFAECAFRDGELEKASASTKQSLSLRLYLDGRFAMHQTSDLRPEALQDFVGKAAKLTKELEPDPKRGLPGLEYMAQPPGPELSIYDAGFEQVDARHWIGLAQEVDQALARRGDQDEAEMVSSQGAAYGETSWELLADSRGFVGGQKETAGYVGGGMVFLDKHDQSKRRSGYWTELSRRISGLGSQEQIELIAQNSVERARWQMGAKPGPTGKFPIVVENRVAGKLMGHWLSAAAGQSVDQKRSYLAGQIGQSVAAPILTMQDCPGLKAGLASRWYDSEGMAAGDLDIIKGGVLKNYYLSVYYARKLGLDPTTGRNSNVCYEPTVQKDAEGLCGELENGLFITGFLGGNFNSTTGDFSYGVSGRWYKNGKVEQAVEGMNLSGNAKTFWMQLSALGNDPFELSPVRTPQPAV